MASTAAATFWWVRLAAFGTTGVELQSNGLVVTNSGSTAYFNRTSSMEILQNFTKTAHPLGQLAQRAVT